MWYPKKAAFRAGRVSGTQWDDGSIGWSSFASGYNTTGSGANSTAMGYGTTASGTSSTALGSISTASGAYALAAGYNSTASSSSTTATGYMSTASNTASVAMGYEAKATGITSIALGKFCTASGQSSVAIGNYVSTNSRTGSMVLGDYSTTTTMSAAASNRFYARFAGGYWLYSNSARSSGVYLAASGSSWGTVSDSTRKEKFLRIDGEYVLRAFREFRLGSWNYKGQDPKQYRHYGPMAQDWFAAFGHDGVGTIGNDTTLTTQDVDGILCIAVQALERRTSALRETTEKLNSVSKALLEKSKQFEKLEIRVQEMETTQRHLMHVIQRLEQGEKPAERHVSLTDSDHR